MTQTRKQMLIFLETARPDVRKEFWEELDDDTLRIHVQLVKKMLKQRAADQLAMS